MLLELLAQANAGKRADSGFKAEAWKAVVAKVQEAYNGPVLQIKVAQVKSKVDWVCN